MHEEVWYTFSLRFGYATDLQLLPNSHPFKEYILNKQLDKPLPTKRKMVFLF